MEIRSFQSDDADALVALWQACALTRPWNDPHADIARKLADSPELLLVGLVDGRLVASVMAGYDGHRGWMNYLAVAPEAQGHGYGRAIVRAAESDPCSVVRKKAALSAPGGPIYEGRRSKSGRLRRRPPTAAASAATLPRTRGPSS